MLEHSYPPDVGGCAVACQSMAEGLANRGHSVAVVTSCIEGAEDSPGAVRVLRELAATPARPVSRRLFGWAYRRWHNGQTLRRWIRELRPDLLMVWNLWRYSDQILIHAQNAGVPLVYYIHDGWLIPNRLARWRAFWTRRPERADLRLVKSMLIHLGIHTCVELLLSRWLRGGPTRPTAGEAVFVSESCRQEYIDAGFRVAGAPVVPNGIDLTVFHPAEGDRKPESELRLLYMGRIEPLKGVEILVRALASLGAEVRPWRLDLVGPVEWPSYRERILADAYRAGVASRVRFLGPMNPKRTPDCYRSHNVLVFPSVGTERMPLVILEAMASGVPVVTTLTGGHASFLEDGRNCLVARAGDPAHLGAQLRRLMSDTTLRESLATAALDTVRQRFSAGRVQPHMEVLLERHLEARCWS